jgi:predicted nucleic acid-binding protein
MIVVDTNILVHLYFPSEFTEFSEKLFLKDPAWIAPYLWRSEFRNVLLGFVRKNIIDFPKAIAAIEKAESQMFGHEHAVSSMLVLELARGSGCTAYDCEFVALGKAKETFFVTWEKKLTKTFPEIAISPKAFLEKPLRKH